MDTTDTKDTTKALVHTFVTSRVDYCNSLLYGLHASHLNKVQRVLNDAARLQPWPELLGHIGNKPVKMTYFPPPPTPDTMLMSGIQVIIDRLNIAWGKGEQKKWFTKTTLPTFSLRGGFRVYLTTSGARY